MIGKQVRCFVVHIRLEDDDPLVLGPYTERKARMLADGFNWRVEDGVFEGEGYIHATALRIKNPQSVRQMLREFGK